MKCDIVIPIWNQMQITRDCIESIIRNTSYPYRLILIDNASDEETRRYLESVRNNKALDVSLIRNEENLGFVKAINQGLRTSQSPYVCIFNNDTITTPGWLEEMVEFAEFHKDVGIMNPLCDGPADIPRDEYASIVRKNNKGKYMEMNQCFLFCSLIKREVIDKIGHLDEVFGVGCYDDTDYSMRAGLAGYRCVCIHSAYVHHIHGVSFKAMGHRERIVRQGEREFFKKWPKHLRVGVVFSLSDKDEDIVAANLLSAILYLARQWCWINLWVFGDKNKNKARIESITKKIDMPLHQNIKFNFISDGYKNVHILIRLIERSFGTKKRKKYDVVLAGDLKLVRLLKAFHVLHNTDIKLVDFRKGLVDRLKIIVDELRKKKK
ncbi:MAG: glycosyltransferase family 2 protein [Candidatus Omnitrophota bacterium]